MHMNRQNTRMYIGMEDVRPLEYYTVQSLSKKKVSLETMLSTITLLQRSIFCPLKTDLSGNTIPQLFILLKVAVC